MILVIGPSAGFYHLPLFVYEHNKEVRAAGDCLTNETEK